MVNKLLTKIQIRNSNGYAAFVVLSVIAVAFISYYVLVGPYATIYSKFLENPDYVGLNQTECKTINGHWDNSVCSQLPSRAISVINKSRKAWLVAPFILILGMIIWFFSVIGKRDPRHYDIVRWR